MNLNSVHSCDTRPGRGAGRLPLLGVLLLALGFSSCASVFDAEQDCKTGIALGFVYDYHMQRGANAFPFNVDCVTVLVFDSAGNYLTQQSEERDELLEDPNYRMQLLLEPGDYHLVVYGGLACEDARFDFAPDFSSAATRSGHVNDILVTLPLEDGVSKKQLHNVEERWGGLFYGTHDFTLTEEDLSTRLREETVYLKNDTNDIQVILQEIDSPYTLDYADFDFTIIDDNFVLDSNNDVVEIATEQEQPVYKPYAKENRIMGYVEYVDRNGARLTESEEQPVQVACVEFSTSRLLVKHLDSARLVITRRSTGDTLVDIPLITYLAATRGFGVNWIKTDQEYLDRQDQWTLMFFLQSGVWVDVRIAVNGWTVRLNDVKLDY